MLSPQKATVIITNFNKGKLLLRAIDSLNEQTDQNFDVIIVDDHSQEKETIEVLSYLEINTDILLIRNAKNMGPGYSKNIGTENSTNELIITLDADDTLPPNAVSDIKQTFQAHPISSFVFGNYQIIDVKTGMRQLVDCSEITPKSLTKRWTMLGSSPYFKAAWRAVGGFNTVQRISDDVDFFKKMLLLGYTGTHTSQTIYNWHRHKGHGVNTSGGKFDFFLAKLRLIEFEFNFSEKPKLTLLIKLCSSLILAYIYDRIRVFLS